MATDDGRDTLMNAALSYAKRGWPVFPIVARTKEPLTEHGFKDGTTDSTAIVAWWRKYPDANIGIVTGESSGIWVFDVDLDEETGTDGRATLREMETKRGPLPDTVIHDTPRGGDHRIFKLNGKDIRNRTAVAPGLDVRGTGGYILAPPSIHPNGLAYRWRDGHDPTEIELCEAPGWLVDLVTRREAAPPQRSGFDRPSDAYTAAAFGRIISELARAAPLSRNNSLNNAALALGHFIGAGSIGRGQCEIALRSTALAIGLTEREVDKTIKSGLDAGIREPAKMPEGRTRLNGYETRGTPYDDRPNDEVVASLGEWDAGMDNGNIPPRQWLLGNVFCRRFVSSLIGDGAVGKSSLRLAQLLSLAIGRSLTGEHVFHRARVLIISLEDDRDEMRRRLCAAMMHHHVERDEIRGWLFLATPSSLGLKLAVTEFGVHKPAQMVAVLTDTIRRLGIDVVSIDPFVKSHAVEENDNNAINFVITILANVAISENCAVDALHHVSKGPADPGNASRSRGGGAFAAGARLVYTLSPMTDDEAKGFNISEAERRSLVRMDSGKVNIAPPSAEASWFRIVGVNIGNATADYPNGDEIATVEVWDPPDLWDGLSSAVLNEILTRIDQGLPSGTRYSDQPRAKDTAAWKAVVACAPDKNEKQARAIVRAWVKSGLVISELYPNSVTRKEERGLRVIHSRRPT